MVSSHAEYKVKLPVRNCKATQAGTIGHCDMQVKAKTFFSDAVTYSGPTYIGIRSANNLGLSAYNHLVEMKRIQELPEFERSFNNSKNEENLIMIVTVDGGPDENP